MKLIVTILNNEDKLEDILHQAKTKKLNNITIINSNSKVNGHNRNKSNRIYGSIRTFLDYNNDESRTILKVATDEEIQIFKNILSENVDKKEYMFFTIPIDDYEGIQ